MKNLTISNGWLNEEEPVKKKKKFCEHKSATVTIDYDYGIEHCSYCGALGHYNSQIDKIEWTLPEYLVKQNYN